MPYCVKCGKMLIERACEGEPTLIPYCPHCEEFRFETFNVAVCTAAFSPDQTRILMMRQYGREKYNFLAGYVNKGESAEEALKREMLEEMNLVATKKEFLYTAYFAKSNTLMLNYRTVVSTDALTGQNKKEVDDVKWFTYAEATRFVIPGSLAEKLLISLKDRFLISTP